MFKLDLVYYLRSGAKFSYAIVNSYMAFLNFVEREMDSHSNC